MKEVVFAKHLSSRGLPMPMPYIFLTGESFISSDNLRGLADSYAKYISNSEDIHSQYSFLNEEKGLVTRISSKGIMFQILAPFDNDEKLSLRSFLREFHSQ